MSYNYDFKVGDEVITFDGEKGMIVEICDCEHCKSRGFLEPIWKDEEGNRHWITIEDAKYDFQYFYKIGDYRFSDFCTKSVLRDIAHHERALDKLNRQLKLIKELETEEDF